MNTRFNKAFQQVKLIGLFRLLFWGRNKNHSFSKEIKIASKGKMLLIDLFKSKEEYQMIIRLLGKENYISKNTSFWMDISKGYKSVIIALIKDLQIKGYYHLKRCVSHLQIRDISLNSFGVEISMDYIKHIKHNDINFNFIPESRA